MPRAAAVHVAEESIFMPSGAPLPPGGFRPDLAARERAVTLHVEDPDVLAGGVVDEEPRP